MANFMYQGQNIYYEEHGAGEPLVVLNGIFMSAASWSAFVPVFSAEFRLILVDFLDQGRSGRLDREYTQELQIELISALLSHLSLSKAHILSISYGAEVAMRFAAKEPKKVDRLILANTTAYTGPWLRDIGKSWQYALETGDVVNFFKTCIPIVYSGKFYESNYEWVQRREAAFVKAFTADDLNAFGRLTRSADTHDARAFLADIEAPTLVISSAHDFVTPIEEQEKIVSAVKDCAHIVIPDAGHAVMYEKPMEFAAAIIGFLKLRSKILIDLFRN